MLFLHWKTSIGIRVRWTLLEHGIGAKSAAWWPGKPASSFWAYGHVEITSNARFRVFAS